LGADSPTPLAASPASGSADDLAKQQAEQQIALNMELTGLALSGGGIRSATFALGVLQGLASFNLLRRFDYLSTVSGGGYIGSWLATWIKREGDIDKVEQQLKPGRLEQAAGRDFLPDRPMDEEPEPIYHLRAYSSYLAPHRGLFSADSWVLLAIYLRNIFLNQLVLFPACVAALLVPRLQERLYDWSGTPGWDTALLVIMMLAWLAALFGIAFRFLIVYTQRGKAWTDKIRLQRGVQIFHLAIVLPLFLFAILASWFLAWEVGPTPPSPQHTAAVVGLGSAPSSPLVAAPAALCRIARTAWWEEVDGWLPWNQAALKKWESQRDPMTSHLLSGIILFGSFFGLVVALIAVLFTILQLFLIGLSPGRAPSGMAWWQFRFGGWALIGGFLAGFTGGGLLYLAFAELLKGVYYQPYDVALVTTLGAPLVVLAITTAASVYVGVLGAYLQEDEREWWASLSGWLLTELTFWTVGVGISLFGPVLIVLAPTWGKALLGSGWVTMAAGGVWAGWSSRTGSGRTNQELEWFTRIAPAVFLIGLLALIGLLIDWVHGNALGSKPEDMARYFDHRLDPSVGLLAFLTVLSVGFACLAAWRVGVNTFSLHGLYANRLVRCYLGASRRKDREKIDRLAGAPANIHGAARRPDPVTGFDPTDDFPLARLRIGADPQAPKQSYWGPYPLINTALNLTQGDELAWQERKADSFLLSPRYCGSLSTCYSRLSSTGDDALRLGTAVTLSGAAVSPNMGYHSSPLVTALLTVFNVRLGAWARNPRYGIPGNAGPKLGWLYFFKELFGRTNNRAPYVYLSDGGHFDNLGIYELVRRRCRYIVACDGEQDGNYIFEGLCSVIRKCQIDFGVTIEIDVNAIKPYGAERLCGRHFAVGRIRYDQVEPKAVPGVLVYLKASLTGDEPSDVRNYQEQHPPFPHEPTADQFFTESQFESYRCLGYHIAREVFRDAAQGVQANTSRSDAAHRSVVTQLFTKLDKAPTCGTCAPPRA
jgi:hypothetical protein